MQNGGMGPQRCGPSPHRAHSKPSASAASHLATALQQQRYNELRIVTAPRFLGLLRKAVSPQVLRVVTAELNKDLVHEENRNLTARLFGDPASSERKGVMG